MKSTWLSGGGNTVGMPIGKTTSEILDLNYDKEKTDQMAATS